MKETKEEKLLKRIKELEKENERLRNIAIKTRVQSYAYENFSKILKRFIWDMFQKAEDKAREQIHEEDNDDRLSEIDDILNSMD